MKQKFLICSTFILAASSVYAQKVVQEVRTPLAMGIGWPTASITTTQRQAKTKPKITSNATRTQASCNLVRNGDFEQLDYAPQLGSGNLKSSCYPTSPYEVSDWENTNAGSSDFFTTLTPPNATTSRNPSTAFCGPFVPYNNTPGATNGCLGMYTYTNQVYNGERQQYQEYACQKLTSPLSGARSYYVSMKVYSTSSFKYSSPFGIDITTNDVRDCTATTTPANPGIYNMRLYTASGCGYQSPVISNSQWTPISAIFPGIQGAQYLNLGNFQSNNGVLTRPSNIYESAYMLVDNLELYEIPWAGTNTFACSGQPVTIGIGCTIPGATYTWSASGTNGLPTNSTSIQVTVTPTNTTTYTLTVNLPDGSTSISSVTITVGPPAPIISLNGGLPNDCYRINNFKIDNFDPALTYTVNELSNARGIPVHPITRFFRVAGVDNSNYTEYGYFTVTATRTNCGSATTDVIEAVYPCSEQAASRSSKYTTAYPNPASETITIPEGATGATLINNKGKALRQADTSGKLNVQSLPDGLYNLQMMQNGKLINQRIQVKH